MANGESKSCLFSNAARSLICFGMANVTLTEAAADRIRAILDKQPEATLLRVSVDGGGCSGFSYKFDLTDARNSDDLLVERNGVGVVMGFLYMAVFALFSSTTVQKIRVVAMLGMTAFICRVSFGIMLK